MPGPSGIRTNVAELPFDDVPVETLTDALVTSTQSLSCLKCPVLSKKLVACQKGSSKLKKEVKRLKERIEELQNLQHYVRFLPLFASYV